MSDRDLRNLYEGVRRGDEYHSPRRVSDLYRVILCEEDEPPIISRDNSNEPDRITLFYTLDNNTYNNLKSVPGVEQVQMDYEYFLDSVKGRLDQKMKEAVDDLTLMGLNGKKDPVATRGLYDVFAKYHVTGDAACALHNSLKTPGHEDFLYNQFSNIGEFGVISVIPALIQNLQNRGFDFGPAKDNPVAFLNDLWDVKDVKGRTSVGRGELCMSMLSVAIKGEPGDVKFQPGEDKVPDRLAQPNITHAKLHMGGKDAISIEVKGEGGRPGKGKEADKFVPKVLKLLKTTDIDPNKKITYAQASVDQQNLVDRIQQNVRVYRMTGEQVIQKMIEGGLNKIINNIDPKKIGNDTERRAYIDTLSDELIQYLNNGNNFQDIANKNTVIEYFTDWTGRWRDAVVDVLKGRTNPIGELKRLISPGTSTGAGVFHILHEREFLVGDEISMLKSMSNKFKDAVTTLFTEIAHPSGSGDPVIPYEILTQAMWCTRADAASVHLCPFADDLQGIMESLDLTDVSNIQTLVGCVQVTAYCMDDKFSHAMFVNDKSPNKTSLVVRCSSEDPGKTFTNLYNAFTENGVGVKLDIDAQNKGVQIFFTR